MNKASELFKKIIVDGTEIDLQQLDNNSGKYNIGEQKSNVRVDFIFKNKEEIPEKLFTNTNIKKITIPESFKTIGNEAFAYTSLSYINLPSYISIGKDVFKDVENLPEEVIENITYNNPYALYNYINNINALDLENSTSKNILIDSSEVANLYGTNKPYFKNVVIKDAEINSTISVKALENITFDGITGSGDKGATNGKITFTTYSLNIKNVTVGEDTTIYNLFEGSQVLDDSNYHGIYNVNVENVNIDCPALTHNIINVYTPATGANIVIKDSTFNLDVNNSNVLRMANYMNSENVTITFDNVEWNYEDAANDNSDWKWAGLMIFQPASQDVSLTGDYSKLATWTINFNNCKYNGQDITGMNVGEHNKLLYFYNLNGNKKCVNPLQAIEGITININGEKQEPETYTAEEAAAYNTTLDGALQYGAVKTPASHIDAIAYTDAEVEEFNTNINGTVKIGDPSEDIYINDYDTNKIEYIYDENTWNKSYENGIMKKYYETYPDEDWYNPTAHRAANLNDKVYDIDIYEDSPAIYSFVSYDSQEKTTKWGEGTVKVIEMRAGGATVEVIENESTDPNAANFVGQQFNVATGLATDEPIQLYTLNDEATGIWVTVELISEATTVNSETPTRTGLSFKAGWISDNVQSLTNLAENSSEVYYTDMFYSLDENKHELFTDSACTTSANKFAKFNTITFPECIHCWEGVVTAPGAQLPWVGVWFDEDLAVKMIYNYEGKTPIKPWGDNKIFGNGDGHKAWGFASVAKEFQDNTFLIEANKNNGNEAWNGTVGEVFGQFDINKFSLVLEKTIFDTYDKEGANTVNAQIEGALQYDSIKTPAIDTPAELYTNEEVDAYNAQLTGAVKEGDIKK